MKLNTINIVLALIMCLSLNACKEKELLPEMAIVDSQEEETQKEDKSEDIILELKRSIKELEKDKQEYESIIESYNITQ